MGKGSKRRPRSISREEEDLRYDLALAKIDRNEFDRRLEEMNKDEQENNA